MPVRVIDAVAEQLPLGDGSIDAAVVSLVLCTVPDPEAAGFGIERCRRVTVRPNVLAAPVAPRILGMARR